ncbi:MAG TPA: hypothetical protein VHX88_18050 [Solirubrobacteraceae bacterium]|jgi:O-antigen ligase|nr:hypothetical protein [Solirubrobacteraceae bacterium]
MSNSSVTELVGVAGGTLALVAYVALILIPSWTAYSRLRERLAAAFLSLYVLAAFVGVGLAGGAAVVYFWDRL